MGGNGRKYICLGIILTILLTQKCNSSSVLIRNSRSTNKEKTISINNESLVREILQKDEEVALNNSSSYKNSNNTNFNKTDFIHNDIDSKAINDQILEDQVAVESRNGGQQVYRGKIKFNSSFNKQKEKETQNSSNNTRFATESSRLNSTLLRNRTISENKLKQSNKTTDSSDEQNEDQNKDGRSFNIDKYISPEFHNINNVYNQDISPDVARYANAEFFDSDEIYSESKHKTKSTVSYLNYLSLTTPSSLIFDERYRQIQNEIKTNVDTFNKKINEESSTEKPYKKSATKVPKNTTVNFENVLTIEHFDSEEAGSKHINTVVENNTHLDVQSNYVKTEKYDQKLPEPIQTLDITTTLSPKDNELDYVRMNKNIRTSTISPPRPTRTRISLKNNKIISNNKSSAEDLLESSEKNVIIKTPTVKWKPYYLSTQTPTSIDPIFDSFEETQNQNSTNVTSKASPAKRGSLKYADTLNKSEIQDDNSYTTETPTDSVVQEDRLHLVQIKAPNSTDMPETTTTEDDLTTVTSESPFETIYYEEDGTTTEMSLEMNENVSTTTTMHRLLRDTSEEELTTATERATTIQPSESTTTQAITELPSTTEASTISSQEVWTEMFELSTEKTKTTTDTIQITTTTEENEENQTSTTFSGIDVSMSSSETASTTEKPMETTTQIVSTIASDINNLSTSTEKTSTTINGKLIESTIIPPTTTTVESTTLMVNVKELNNILVTTEKTEITIETVSPTKETSTTVTVPTPTIIPTTISHIQSHVSFKIDEDTDKNNTNRIKLSTVTDKPSIKPLNESQINFNKSTTPLDVLNENIDNSIKVEKSNFLSNSNEETDTKTSTISPNNSTKTPISTTTINYKHVDNTLLYETNQLNRTPKFEKRPKTTLPNIPIPDTTTKYIHKINENSIYKQHSTSTVDGGNNLPVIPEEQPPTVVSTTTSTTFKPNNLSTESSQDPDVEYERSSVTIIAIVIISIAAICLVLLAILLIIMRRRQKRFNYGQRCTPVSLDAYSLDSVSVYNSVRRKGQIRASKRSYGNPAFEDTETTSHPLNFPSLTNFANNEEEIAKEYENIPIITVQTTEVPPGCEAKNRYANIIPLPETRVYLTKIEGDPHSDYINANFVRGPKNAKAYYIATQAPLENTIDDFWRMVWEQQSKLIMMLTDLFENGVEKCFDYLPPSEVLDCHRQFGDFQITLKKREVKEKYIVHTIQLKNLVSNCWREVTHMWYLGWPERGTPSEVDSMIAFLIEARSYTKNHNSESSADCSRNDKTKESTNGFIKNGDPTSGPSPIVVHCSPGTGRTGTVIACDILMKEFELTRTVDVPKTVYRIRRDRASSVQTKDQYAYIYKVINTYATKLAGGALDSI